MHYALQIVEVVEIICEHLAQLDASTGDLARLARTSTLFLDPALNVLWRHQGTLVNLLRCMPSDVWDITETRYEDEDDDVPGDVKIDLRRPITLVDWERFRFYSHRVKSFHPDQKHWLETPKVYETLDLCFPEQPIFPNLRALDWWPHADGSFDYIRLFLSPRISNLHMTAECIPHPSTLPLLSSKCPSLKNISISMAPGPALSKFVRGLHHLETLVVTDLNTAALSHIARLPGLLYLWLMSSSPVPSFRPSAGSLPFPALQRLEYESIEHAPRLLELMAKCSLVELTIIARGFNTTPPPNTIAQQFYSALATYCSHSSLRKINVQRNGHAWTINADQHSIYLVKGDILHPLFSFSNLVNVSLSHPVGVDLDDTVVRKMATAWPQIESLLLPPERSHRITPRATLEGIYAFAQHCPRLRSLHLVFDASIVPELKSKGEKTVCQRALRYLDVSYSPVGKPRPVAKFLSAIFPHLHTISTLYYALPKSMADAKAEVLASHMGWNQVLGAL
ncbi:hypothetical protein DFH08DRAFT_934427 [Mycena albidolilacea]|uniref:F-box domain-containing protein n=1 Tax=Mycena albidolilacea TaxID=1033008 RepID=A0AAD7AAL8_9AGAR|nr:hypothetical protein DFH08DRAFT_934427 [Mycena albidolilacea]